MKAYRYDDHILAAIESLNNDGAHGVGIVTQVAMLSGANADRRELHRRRLMLQERYEFSKNERAVPSACSRVDQTAPSALFNWHSSSRAHHVRERRWSLAPLFQVEVSRNPVSVHGVLLSKRLLRFVTREPGACTKLTQAFGLACERTVEDLLHEREISKMASPKSGRLR